MGINKVILIGRLGQDPELRYTPNGTPVANFNIATNYAWTDKKGEKQTGVDWHRIVAWNKLGEICAEYLVKGRQVYVEGKLKTRSWEKDGHKFYITEVVAVDVQFLSGRNNRDERVESPPAELTNVGDHKDDDIPF